MKKSSKKIKILKVIKKINKLKNSKIKYPKDIENNKEKAESEEKNLKEENQEPKETQDDFIRESLKSGTRITPILERIANLENIAPENLVDNEKRNTTGETSAERKYLSYTSSEYLTSSEIQRPRRENWEEKTITPRPRVQQKQFIEQDLFINELEDIRRKNARFSEEYVINIEGREAEKKKLPFNRDRKYEE